MMRTGEEVRLSTPLKRASSLSKPSIFFPNARIPSSIEFPAVPGGRTGRPKAHNLLLYRVLPRRIPCLPCAFYSRRKAEPGFCPVPPPGFFFKHTLKSDSPQRPFLRKILRRNRHDQGAVCISAVSCLVTHTVYCQKSLLRGSVDHISSRTHTEGVDASSVLAAMGQLVAGRPQVCVSASP